MTSRRTVRIAALLAVAGLAAAGMAAAGSPKRVDPYAVLDGLTTAGKPVMFTFVDEPLRNVFVAIGQASGLTITVEAKGDRRITIRTGKVPLKDALVQIGNEQGLDYDVTGADRLVVRDRVPRPE